MYKSILNQVNETIKIFELTINHFNSIAQLNLKLRIISDSFHESFIVQEIPFILVIIFNIIKMALSRWINLKHFDFLKAWAHIFSN
jgi:hypothetical protein